MRKLKIRITNEEMLRKLSNKFSPELAHKTVKFGIEDEMERIELYPEEVDEYIGIIKPWIPTKDNDSKVYTFEIDRCNVSHFKIHTIHTLDAQNQKDRALFIKALEHDYGLCPEDYEILN